jgi:hypothetical protein
MTALQSLSSSRWVCQFRSDHWINNILHCHSASSWAALASNNFSRCPMVLCSCSHFCACCHIVHSMRLILSLGALEASEPLIGHFPFTVRSSGSAAASVARAACVTNGMPTTPYTFPIRHASPMWVSLGWISDLIPSNDPPGNPSAGVAICLTVEFPLLMGTRLTVQVPNLLR